jgi:hypothetical protein
MLPVRIWPAVSETGKGVATVVGMTLGGILVWVAVYALVVFGTTVVQFIEAFWRFLT